MHATLRSLIVLVLAALAGHQAASTCPAGEYRSQHYDLLFECDLDPQETGQLLDALHEQLTAYFGKAPPHRLQMEIHGSREQYLEALKRNSRSADALTNLGTIHYDQGKGNIEVAIDYFSRAVDADNTHASAQYNLGLAYSVRGDYVKALRALHEAEKLAPLSADVHYALGLTLMARGTEAPALKSFRAAVEANPGHVFAHEALAIAESE